MEPLTDAELARLAPKISSMTMRNIAVQQLEFSEEEVETLIDECRDDKQSFVRKVLTRWRNRNFAESTEAKFLIVCRILIFYFISK